MMNRWTSILLVLLLMSFSPAQQSGSKEYQLKAAFIYKFTNYIEWNAHMPGNNFVIGIIGSSPIKEHLAELANSKKIYNKKIVIRQYNKVGEIDNCQILFIPQKTTMPLEEILQKAKNKGTLTVSERSGYAAQGTSINFILVNEKLKFEANPKAINAAGLNVSSQLLKLATIVDQSR